MRLNPHHLENAGFSYFVPATTYLWAWDCNRNVLQSNQRDLKDKF
jgi:hypothetical protein